MIDLESECERLKRRVALLERHLLKAQPQEWVHTLNLREAGEWERAALAIVYRQTEEDR